MSRTVIRVENLSKQYRLGQVSTGTLGHDLNRWWHRVRGKDDPYLKIGEVNDRTRMGSTDYVWALKNINFEVKDGEVLGIIGRNGAGKSTLLKILSRTTAPTHGSVKIKGHIASLLEVGTGFHPELSGRENIFLNGAILGMTKEEIKRRFDQIVDFAGVERYIDTPVKRYSSGMYVRLAFSVAAHLEPEIMILDEVLAVGDAEFQNKCIGRMREVSEKDGRTILFVSHNMEIINRICDRVILLKNGTIGREGTVESVTSAYLRSDLGTSSHRNWTDAAAVPGNDFMQLLEARVHNTKGETKEIMEVSEQVGITFTFRVLQPVRKFTHGFTIKNESGLVVFSSHDLNTSIGKEETRLPGLYEVTGWIPPHFLAEGLFTIAVAAFENYGSLHIHFNEPEALAFTVIDYIDGNSARGFYPGRFPGIVRPLLQWEARTIHS
ncbi:ABC transporter ATP-binding protein [Flavisolibacter nicotianae]|uniref:ABC transporter ATP-binding protein n=1 Tax=Flavisolibacter nicotianae TaxID=2364882 RepID=UPI000EB56676|nr:ABC transporter ATP-binding protein [Flavisolibacter nicotianae]